MCRLAHRLFAVAETAFAALVRGFLPVPSPAFPSSKLVTRQLPCKHLVDRSAQDGVRMYKTWPLHFQECRGSYMVGCTISPSNQWGSPVLGQNRSSWNCVPEPLDLPSRHWAFWRARTRACSHLSSVLCLGRPHSTNVANPAVENSTILWSSRKHMQKQAESWAYGSLLAAVLK